MLANCEDTTNTNITLTVREIAPASADRDDRRGADSVDILELSGATFVLPLKHQLGDYLANRVDVGRPERNVVGDFRGSADCRVAGTRHAVRRENGARHASCGNRRG